MSLPGHFTSRMRCTRASTPPMGREPLVSRQTGKAGLEQIRQEGRGLGLEQGFAAGNQHQPVGLGPGPGPPASPRHGAPALIGVSSVAIAAAQVAAGQADEIRRHSRPGGFTHQAGKGFADHKRHKKPFSGRFLGSVTLLSNGAGRKSSLGPTPGFPGWLVGTASCPGETITI